MSDREMSHAGPSVAADEACLRDTGMVGQSPAFCHVLGELRRAAALDAPLLIEGETGSGKELAARAAHYLGARRAGPFVPINCGALAETLLEAELFGHERGAFTDAKTARRGLVAEAQGGTLFLDEVDALSARAQVALLRFLQDQRFRPVGGRAELTSNARVIAASNRSLHRLAEEGGFRADLLYRLDVLRVVLPPLRERAGDVVLLARHFAGRLALKYGLPELPFAPAAIQWMARYGWPGNVRELEGYVHRALLMSAGSTLHALPPPQAFPCMPSSPETLPVTAAPFAADEALGDKPFHIAKAEALARFERHYVLALLRRTGGNVTRAAAIAGKERRAFGKLLKKHGIDRAHVGG